MEALSEMKLSLRVSVCVCEIPCAFKGATSCGWCFLPIVWQTDSTSVACLSGELKKTVFFGLKYIALEF